MTTQTHMHSHTHTPTHPKGPVRGGGRTIPPSALRGFLSGSKSGSSLRAPSDPVCARARRLPVCAIAVMSFLFFASNNNSNNNQTGPSHGAAGMNEFGHADQLTASGKPFAHLILQHKHKDTTHTHTRTYRDRQSGCMEGVEVFWTEVPLAPGLPLVRHSPAPEGADSMLNRPPRRSDGRC